MANTTNTIKNLTNLIFFNDKGQELYAQKDYVIEWSLVPCNEVSVYFHENVSGYFLAGIKYEDGSQTPVIDYTKLVTGFINSGGIYFVFSSRRGYQAGTRSLRSTKNIYRQRIARN